MQHGTIRELWRYPVSSLTGERLDLIDLDATGVAGDRQWGLFDAGSMAVAAPESERRWRPAPGLQARMGADGPEISTDGSAWHRVPSPAADAAASNHLAFPVRFQHFGEIHAIPRYERDPLHILTTASLARLQALLPAAIVDTRRFRPNILVETGDGEVDFVEQRFIGKRLLIGAAVVEITEPCTRCAFTALGQPGLPFDKDVLHAIARHGDGGFGVLAKVVATGRIALGDTVAVEETY
ncbi:MOSC domain-containing protein [Shinella sp. CPCC 101442]|uniref:MOSC domain-containing protein n=1 Tax=Shinella sp. CPCC 101442 TaxID=2932265 RepID=UPI00215389A3|nr:MOSC domain-containing protein [Shinella sp. CPCC 101442]MCR6501558.1 MOSC domain-containing protein [Shinella sp. CPCC 101442]